MFVLTGQVPIPTLRVTVRRRFGLGAGVTYQVNGELADDPELAARAIRAARQREALGGRGRSEENARRLELVRAFGDEHGTGERAVANWNRQHPDPDWGPEWRYSGRRAFYRAYKAA
jgi:hypothetical protein